MGWSRGDWRGEKRGGDGEGIGGKRVGREKGVTAWLLWDRLPRERGEVFLITVSVVLTMHFSIRITVTVIVPYFVFYILLYCFDYFLDFFRQSFLC